MSGGRIRQILLLATFLPWCWLMMMVVHEVGHVLAAWSTGAMVERVVLHPLAISRTDLSENPHPLLVSWAGAVVGSLLPVLIWLGLWATRFSLASFARFFAGFCLLANGVYLGMGAWTGDGDAGDLMRQGASVWHLAVFGITAVTCGLWSWHGLGTSFGLNRTHENITWSSVVVASIFLAITVMFELGLGSVNDARPTKRKTVNDPSFTFVKRNDPEVANAHAKAAATIDEFIVLVQKEKGANRLAKLRFRDPDLSEKLGEDRFFYLWLNEVVYHPSEKLLSGAFFEVPDGFEKWHQVGSRLAFEPEDVFDWMIQDNGRLRGGFTIRLHRSRLPEDQRLQYDEFIGATSYDPPEH